jgi:hypothetical protein
MELYTIKAIGVKDTPGIEFTSSTRTKTIPVVGRSKAWFCGRSLAGSLCSNPAGALVFVSVGWCQVEVSATVLSIVRMSSTECGVSECDREASTMRGALAQ